MSSQETAPYGTWDSPITSDTVVSANIVFDDVLVDPITQVIYHLEERPEDHGRCVIVNTNAKKDVLPSPYSARDSVHDYGGAPAIVYGGIIYFSNDSTDSSTRNRIYALNLTDGSAPKGVTPENRWWRYANFAVHPQQTNLLVTIREDHTNDPDGDAPQNVVNTLCVVDTSTASVNIIVDGADFYATPVFNPSGNKIGWQEWYLPDMPWEGGLIYVADIDVTPGSIEVLPDRVLVAGEKQQKSATFPSWITDTTLVYITDRDNKFQNPFIFNTDTQQSTPVLKSLLPQDFAEPAWWLGFYPYAILNGGNYGAFTAFQDGGNILYIIDLTTSSDPVLIQSFDYTVAQHLRAATDNTFVFTGTKTSSPGGLILGTVSGSSGSYDVDFTTLKPSAEPSPLEDYISKPKPISLKASDGHTIYVVYYAPYNPDYSGSSILGEKPPCIIGVHGGPTGLEPQSLNWIKMFYTSRGFAWQVLTSASELLNGNWGIYDVADCREAATTLSGTSYSLIDVNRVTIRGGSAGSYTTLSSLTFAKEPKFYKTACSAYGGVADPALLTQIVEKFEMRYMYTLFGCPPDNGAWDTRSPIKNITNPETGEANLSVPLLMLHGDVDRVVPPVVPRGFLKGIADELPTEQLEFSFYPSEGHHWHLAFTIKDALEREFTWYKKNLL
ncbi:Alpha/Beta hydrolase protein [Lanmaoa asiatica]|nr:Alpha/Beta hydrolase protein [Lanmaoa asiatica]